MPIAAIYISNYIVKFCRISSVYGNKASVFLYHKAVSTQNTYSRYACGFKPFSIAVSIK